MYQITASLSSVSLSASDSCSSRIAFEPSLWLSSDSPLSDSSTGEQTRRRVRARKTGEGVLGEGGSSERGGGLAEPAEVLGDDVRRLLNGAAAVLVVPRGVREVALDGGHLRFLTVAGERGWCRRSVPTDVEVCGRVEGEAAADFANVRARFGFGAAATSMLAWRMVGTCLGWWAARSEAAACWPRTMWRSLRCWTRRWVERRRWKEQSRQQGVRQRGEQRRQRQRENGT